MLSVWVSVRRLRLFLREASVGCALTLKKRLVWGVCESADCLEAKFAFLLSARLGVRGKF